MPLLSPVDYLYVGDVAINRVYAGTDLVWPKSCSHTSGRPNPLPPANNGDARPMQFRYDSASSGTLLMQWSRWGSAGLYSGYQCELFDTEYCRWEEQGVTANDQFSNFVVPQANFNDLQTYDARVTGVFTATGLPDEAMWRYASTNDGSPTSNPYVTVPSRAPSPPFRVLPYTNDPGPGSVKVIWNPSAAPNGYTIAGYKIEIKPASTGQWELIRETTGTGNTIYFTAADGLVSGQRYTLRVAGITSVCLSQSGWTESDPFTFT